MWKQEPATQLHGNRTLPHTVTWKQNPATKLKLHGNRTLPHTVMWKQDPAIQLSRRIPPHSSVMMKWNQGPATQLNSWNWDPTTHLAGTMWSRNSLTYSNISTPLGVVGSRQKTYVQEGINPLEHSKHFMLATYNHQTGR